jgi:hypothetical protein
MLWTKKHQTPVSTFSELSNNEHVLWIRNLFETPIHIHQRYEIKLPDLDDGLGWPSGLESRQWVYDAFRDFDLYLNSFHKPDEDYDCGPWVIEQQSDPFLTLFGYDDSPIIGIKYKIFYNSQETGILEIRPSSEASQKSKYALISMQINNAMFFPFDHLEGLMSLAAERLLPDVTFTKSDAISKAITRIMWEFNRTGNAWLDLDFEFSGTLPND